MADSVKRGESRFQGVGVSPGIAIAEVQVIGVDFREPDEYPVAAEEIPGEIKRFEAALKATRSQILAMQDQIAQAVGSRDASIFDAHLLVLEDRTVLDEVIRELKGGKRNIEAAFYGVMKRYLDSLRKIDDPYLRERVIDVEDVARRVIRNLDGSESGRQVRASEKEHILVSHELTPGDTASIDRNLVMGFATEAGGTTSHTAIMARSLNIPAIVGLHGICEALHTGDRILLDGYHGLLFLNPTEETISSYGPLREAEGEIEDQLHELKDTKSATRDGRAIILSGNIEFVHEVEQVRESGAEGVGLYRTEFFFLKGKRLPTEEEQAESYSEVAMGVQPHAVIFRTLDVGGDKICEGTEDDPEPNPFLGWRGIRVSLKQRDIFEQQLRAILRASNFGKVGIMYPLISGLGEVRQANAILEECKREFRDKGIGFDEDIEVGAMIEVPSAALITELIAPEVDFFSIGTNDLIQYTIAVDRVNERVADLYQPTHPAVLRLMKKTVEAARNNGIWAGICGEMAGEIVYTPLMVGMGFDELSVAMGQLPRVKHAVQHLESGTCEALVEEVLQMGDPREIYEKTRSVAMAHYPELMH